MIFEKCLDCARPAKEHYYAIQDTIIEPNPRNPREQFVLVLSGWYAQYGKWTRVRVDKSKFKRIYCVPHRLIKVKIDIGKR